MSALFRNGVIGSLPNNGYNRMMLRTLIAMMIYIETIASKFYCDKITVGDTLLKNTIESIFSEKYDKSKKGFWLKKLENEGFFLIDAVEYPIDQFKKDKKKRNRHVRINFNNLIEKIEKLGIDKNTKIILIKKNIFEILGEKLKEKGFHVLNDKLLPFPDWGINSERYQKELKELLLKE